MLWLTLVALLDSDQVGQQQLVHVWTFNERLTDEQVITEVKNSLAFGLRPEHWVLEVKQVLLKD